MVVLMKIFWTRAARSILYSIRQVLQRREPPEIDSPGLSNYKAAVAICCYQVQGGEVQRSALSWRDGKASRPLEFTPDDIAAAFSEVNAEAWRKEDSIGV